MRALTARLGALLLPDDQLVPSVRVQRRVQGDAVPSRASASTAPVTELRRSSMPSGPDSVRAATTCRGQRDLGARRDVRPGLDHAVVAERMPSPALAPRRQRRRRDDLLAAAGERPHHRRTAADVGAVADTTPAEIRPSTIDEPSVPAL